MSNPTAMIFGATGAVGKEVLKDLLTTGKYSKVVSVGRRTVELDSAIPQDKLEQKVVDFDNLEADKSIFKGVSDVFCCLGTTRAAAGSAENFVKIDQTYVLNSAKLIAEENKPSDDALAPVHFLYCSSTGANKDSMFLYIKTKGQTEEALKETGFEKVSIFQPGLLEIVDPRPTTRWGERFALAIVPPLNRMFNLHSSVPVTTVAKAMHHVAENKDIKAKSSSQSVIGSLVSVFSTAEIEDIGK
ncbi:Oxidoreductase HTATIP2 [Choanephora cucurbitarum]|uniref:Oxidoreductase HTATIP2 n=1 Tax=Choanephora cucurbitarum TaxID=101091 RepID=A0A1C7ND42_9FUNG|nr:Oxidoreductase HTATIP2 [Choanephora cucurbitarum]